MYRIGALFVSDRFLSQVKEKRSPQSSPELPSGRWQTQQSFKSKTGKSLEIHIKSSAFVRKVPSTIMGHKPLKSLLSLFLPSVGVASHLRHCTKSAFLRPVAKLSQLVSSAKSRPLL